MTLPAGPNGLHGTPEPNGLFSAQSHGCVRPTNWGAEELAGMVEGTAVEFEE